CQSEQLSIQAIKAASAIERTCSRPWLQSRALFGIAVPRPRGYPLGRLTLLGCGCSSGVEHNLAKVGVEGSNPFARSKNSQSPQKAPRPFPWVAPDGRIPIADSGPGITRHFL